MRSLNGRPTYQLGNSKIGRLMESLSKVCQSIFALMAIPWTLCDRQAAAALSCCAEFMTAKGC